MRARNTTDISPIGVLMLDVKQVAASCGIGTSTVWKLVKLGTFPRPVYFGPKVARFKAEDIQKWVANLEPATTPLIGNHTEQVKNLRKQNPAQRRAGGVIAVKLQGL